MNKKKDLGQFYTTRYKYILQGMSISDNISHIVEPFAGNGEMLKFITTPSNYTIECYDIDPQISTIIQRDTLLHPPDLNNKFVITNPPYLGRNKSSNKVIFDIYGENDLYKCFMRILINHNVIGGIIIIPLNFWSSIRKSDAKLRKDFLNLYNIILLNIFQERVFNDTSYTVCSFQFERISAPRPVPDHVIDTIIYPIGKHIQIRLGMTTNYRIGGELYILPQTDYNIMRLTKKNINCIGITNILVKAIDDSIHSQIRLSITDDGNRYIDTTDKLSERSYATLIIQPPISIKEQYTLVQNFNTFLKEKRDEYNSLFLSNYRENNRKRISFDLVYRIVNYLLR